MKPVAYFQQMRRHFTDITDLLKRSNLNLFKRDLRQRCLDLRYTRDVCAKWPSTSGERVALANELRLDDKLSKRLSGSTQTEAKRQTQLAVIDTLVNELEKVIDVVKDELKARDWATPCYKTRCAATRKLQRVDSSPSSASPTSKTLVTRCRSSTFPT